MNFQLSFDFFNFEVGIFNFKRENSNFKFGIFDNKKIKLGNSNFTVGKKATLKVWNSELKKNEMNISFTLSYITLFKDPSL